MITTDDLNIISGSKLRCKKSYYGQPNEYQKSIVKLFNDGDMYVVNGGKSLNIGLGIYFVLSITNMIGSITVLTIGDVNKYFDTVSYKRDVNIENICQQ